MEKKLIERKSLITSATVNLITGLLGLAVYIITDLNALLLDAVFSIISFVSTLTALLISKNSHRSTPTFPQGMYFLEPLYGMVKSLAILMLLFITCLESASTAYRYVFEHQGIPMTTDLVLPYTILTGAMCLFLYWYNHQKSKELQHMSTIIQAEKKGSLIDCLISVGIGASIILLHFIPIDSPLDFLHYTGDFFITVLLTLFFVKEPIDILVVSFKEFAHSAIPDTDLENSMYTFLSEHFEGQMDQLQIMIHKQGMQLTARIHVKDAAKQAPLIAHLAQKRPQLYEWLEPSYPYLSIDIIC